MNNTVKVGDKTLTLSPLTLAELKRAVALAADFQRLDESAKEHAAVELADAYLQIMLASLKRNDPTVTLAQLENSWTHADFEAACRQLLSLSMPVAPLMPGAIN